MRDVTHKDGTKSRVPAYQAGMAGEATGKKWEWVDCGLGFVYQPKPDPPKKPVKKTTKRPTTGK